MNFGANAQPFGPDPNEIILATTTSTYDSGLLDVLIPVFEQETGYLVKIVSVGTGQALQMGAQGNADILLVHAPDAELQFMSAGWGLERRLVMHNDFVIVGPPDDPAGLTGIRSPSEALRTISDQQAAFVSRGDASGTHKKEIAYWEAVQLSPSGDWYIESGQGMGATLRVASELAAYTLTDRATYTSLKKILDLEVFIEGDRSLLNLYHAMTVNPEQWPAVNIGGAQALLAYFLNSDAQDMIRDFGVPEYGAPLFIPDAGKRAEDYGFR